MKTVILVRYFPPKWLAGTELASYNIAKYMGKNHEVNVITSQDVGIPNQSNMGEFDVYRISLSKMRFLGLLLYWFKIFLTIKRLKPEVIQVQGLCMALPAVLAKKILNIPYIVSGRGSDVYVSWPFKEMISKLGLRNATISMALTENMKKEMQKIYDSQIEVIPNGIDTKRFNLNKYESREKLGLNHNQKIVLFVGRLERVKGVKYLIKAINNLSREDLKLIIVGDGRESHSLKLLVKKMDLTEKIMFMGKIPNEKIPEYMVAADVFVLPSLSEGFPVVLLEAMAAGIPIISTKIRGLTEIVENNANGFLVNPKNPEEIADKINIILTNENLAKKISKTNKQRSMFYDWKNIVGTLEKLYNSTITDN